MKTCTTSVTTISTAKPQGHTDGGFDMLTTSSQLTQIGKVKLNPAVPLLALSKNGQVNQQTIADRPVSSLLGLIRTLQLVVDSS